MEMELLSSAVYWAVLISLGAYLLGKFLQEKTKFILFNPLLFSAVFTAVFLILFHIDYETYFEKADYLYYLLTPTTVCLAIPLYEQIKPLKENLVAIVCGILAGSVACLCSILVFAMLFGFSHTMYVTILPKSITAAMAMGSLTVPIVIMTGITGHIIAETVCKVFCITEPIAKGIAIGSASHAMGTAKAIEMGKIEGAMSGLAIAVAGVLTVIGASVFSYFY